MGNELKSVNIKTPLKDYHANLQPRANSQTEPLQYNKQWDYVGPTLDKEAIDKLYNMGIQTPGQLNALIALVDQQHHLRDIPSVTNNPYNTILTRNDEANFRQWLAVNQVPFTPDDPNPDYDMRGYWKALQSGDKRAKPRLNERDGEVHYPDTWKTPSHASFSNESIYAGPDAPRWVDSKLIDKTGKVIVDETPAPQVTKQPVPEVPYYNDRFSKQEPPRNWYAQAPPEAPYVPQHHIYSDKDAYYRVAQQIIQPYLDKLPTDQQPVTPPNMVNNVMGYAPGQAATPYAATPGLESIDLDKLLQ